MRVLTMLLFMAFSLSALADEPTATDIRAVHRHGQTFVTWKDVAESEAGARYRYSLYRSAKPITEANLNDAELCYHGVLNNSARLYGTAFNMKDRIDPSKPYSIIEDGGKPLAPWSGLAVVTIPKLRQSYYAVVATDTKRNAVSRVVPGRSAMTVAVDEKPAPIQPIKLYDSKERSGPYVRNTFITGQKGLPLHISLHGSSGSKGGGAGEYGDYYLYFGTPDMGYRDGLAGVFSVSETHSKAGNHLHIRARDAVEHPSGERAMETYWFGYWCVPQWARHTEPRVYPFTENQLLWIVRWAAERYDADINRITMGGSSSGAVGSNNVGFRHPELFAAVYPSAGRVRKVPAVALDSKLERGAPALMSDGKTSYYDRVDGPRFAASHHGDLPFMCWSCGRRDGYATWQEHIDMVKALTDAHHGFAFAWNNGNHGGQPDMKVLKHYHDTPKLARNRSYPALGNSSLNQNMGNGDPADGDLAGGINLGFEWSNVIDEEDRWAVALSNELARSDMTVDVTPRRCQKFKAVPGASYRWSSSTGGAGVVTADAHGLVTIPRIVIQPGKSTTLTVGGK